MALCEKVALVTGGAQGIGKAVTEALLRSKVKVSPALVFSLLMCCNRSSLNCSYFSVVDC